MSIVNAKSRLWLRICILVFLCMSDCAVLFYILDTAPHAQPNLIASLVLHNFGRQALLLLKFATMGGFIYYIAKLHDIRPYLAEAILEFGLIVQALIVIYTFVRYSFIYEYL